MAAGTEIMGSRNEPSSPLMKYGTMWYVSTDGSPTNLVERTTFFTPKGSSAESAPLGRICTHIDVDVVRFPGLFFHIAHFAGPKEYA